MASGCCTIWRFAFPDPPTATRREATQEEGPSKHSNTSTEQPSGKNHSPLGQRLCLIGHGSSNGNQGTRQSRVVPGKYRPLRPWFPAHQTISARLRRHLSGGSGFWRANPHRTCSSVVGGRGDLRCLGLKAFTFFPPTKFIMAPSSPSRFRSSRPSQSSAFGITTLSANPQGVKVRLPGDLPSRQAQTTGKLAQQLQGKASCCSTSIASLLLLPVKTSLQPSSSSRNMQEP